MIKRFREYVIKNKRRFNSQIYWLIILSLSFIIVIGVIKSTFLLSQIHEVQRFYNKGEGYGTTIILYNNSYFTFTWYFLQF
jgi:hypothetical protein